MQTAIQQNLHSVLAQLPDGVQLVAISKYHPADCIQEAYEAGQRVFGESHEQELSKKHEILPRDIEWHFIGHLQTNKVKYIAPYISMIEAADSVKLLKEINKQALKNERVIDVLLELHLAQEETKFGFSPEQCRQFLDEGEWRNMKGIRICGLMMMASNTDEQQQIEEEFALAYDLFKEFRQTYFADCDYFCKRSWGMSHDYLIATAHGSNMVRVGTRIFGERAYL